MHDTIQVQRHTSSKEQACTTHNGIGSSSQAVYRLPTHSQIFTPSYIPGLECWTGLMDWTGGLTVKIIFMLPNKTHSPVELCGNPAAFSLQPINLLYITIYMEGRSDGQRDVRING